MTTQQSILTLTALPVNEIEFTSKDEVSLMGFICDSGVYHPTQYIINRNDLNELLAQSKDGREIANLIESLFAGEHPSVATLNLLNIFGLTTVLHGANIQAHYAMEQGEDGVMVPCSNKGLVFIERVA